MLARLAARVASFKRHSSRSQWLMRCLGLASESDRPDTANPHQFHRGLVMVQIDGLGHHEFQRALAHGELPFLKQLIDKQHYDVHSLYSGLPSSTPAVQGELFYGIKTAVPAFAYVDNTSGEMQRMYDPVIARAMEAELAAAGRALLTNGSAYCNIYTGGAAESHYCASSFGFGHSLETFKPLARLGIGLIFLPTLLRTVTLVIVELVLAVVDFIRGISSGHRIVPELKFILSRVAICIALRDIVCTGAQVDILRGLPIIHLNLLGYDEQAHRRGPRSAFAHWTLRGIDRSIQRLWQAANESPTRHYDLWIYSDHGQESTMAYNALTGKSLTDALQQAMTRQDPASNTEATSSATQSIGSIRAQLLGGRYLQSLLASSIGKAVDNKPAFRVAAMGPVGHVYADTLSTISNRVELADYMTSAAAVPAAMYLDDDNKVVVKTSEALYHLPADSVRFAGDGHKFADIIGEDLVAICQHQHAGQVILLGWANHTEPVSFPLENGAHAGPGSRETHAFALLPSDTVLPEACVSYLRPLDLRWAAFAVLDKDPDTPTANRFPRPRISIVHSEAYEHEQHRVHGKQTFRLMTYNVHGCVGMDSRHAPERIARVIAQFEPDVVALQELDVNRHRSHREDQAKTIARLLEMQYHFHPSMHVESGAYGNAILTHLPMHIRKAEQLPAHPNKHNVEPRGAIWASLEVAGVQLQVICTHLGLYPEERLRQVDALQSEQWLNHPQCLDRPTILCGDFNATPGSATLKALDNRWRDVQLNTSALHTSTSKTFTSMLPALRIDHVFINTKLQAIKVQVPRFELARRASDHLPLIVDLKVITRPSMSIAQVDSDQNVIAITGR